MDSKYPDKQELFKAYLQGNLLPIQERELVDWINSSDSNYQGFKHFVDENQFLQPHTDHSYQAWQKLKSKIADSSKQNNNRKLTLPVWLRIAAMLVLAVLAGFFASRFVFVESARFAKNEIIVPNGEKAQLVLSDGTRVFLNSGTHFIYPSIFSEKNREVIISGEAFFEVKKDRKHPFIVKTPSFDVKVTGTSFNLNTYKEDFENNLTLHSGEVIISSFGKYFILKPGEKFVYNTQTHNTIISNTDIKKSFMWKDGVIVIDDFDLVKISKVLERKFGVQIFILNDDLKGIRYSGLFKPYETLNEILDMVCQTSPIKFKYEINNTKNEIRIQ